MRNEKDWEEEVSSKCTLKRYRLAKNDAGVEMYLRSVQSQKVVRLLFRLRTGSVGLLEDKKRCKMTTDERCVMGESGVGEDVEHLLVKCVEVKRNRWILMDEVSRIIGAGEWLEEYGRVCKEGKVALLLGRGVEGVSDTVMEEVGECIIGYGSGCRDERIYCM